MVLDITREEMAREMLNQVAERLVAWKVEDEEPGNDFNADEAKIAYQAVRHAACTMRLVPGCWGLTARRMSWQITARMVGWALLSM